MEFWVHGVQFNSGIVGGELPVGSFGVVVLPGCPCGDLAAIFVHVSDADHAAAVKHGMCVHDLNRWKAVLSAAMADLEKQGHAVDVVPVPVAEMLAALKERGLDNTSQNRSQIAWNDQGNEIRYKQSPKTPAKLQHDYFKMG